ncbi:hypothetical protein UFOVP611_26 [uncultured Caudovirales phage]|uniref:Uncharacterized protein n=1 Tax=uncultured Caudovirales phage TaxID=2100421 RepID=A0A6J5MZJ6_9CAUD|nr:hypothetical protein UFOVP611_26 [uncultured Caudovirales phage]
MTAITKFEAGNIYEMRFIGDSDLRVKYICVKRTAKSVTFERFQNPADVLRRGIKVWDGSEFVTEGCYSMAPSINAKHLVG